MAQRDWSRLINGIQVAVPILLVAVVVGLILLKVDTAAQFEERGRQGRQQAARVACETVHRSDLNLHSFLTRSVGSNRSWQRFLDDLLANDETTYRDCLVTVQQVK